ncbi:MAG TPA: GNAT family N-acetyltransferase [Rhizomicrobium sp.]|jgi:ribosomal-protein-alanine N-acetyltransferase|nr:GNAT family N-acetyltransferase [Rhizomicrobium sp.]
MSFHPTTQRLILRAPMMTDKSVFVTLLDDYEVARNLGPVPHPYTDTLFREFLVRSDAERREGTDFNFAVTRAMDGAFMGMCSVHAGEDGDWELGYWYGRPYWGQGYASEAAGPVMRFAFDDMGAARLTSGWFFDNPASGRVLEKLGFTPTGTIKRNCVSRGCEVVSNRVQLTREQFARKKAA